MAIHDASQDDGTPAPIEKGFASLAQLQIGVKAWVSKNGEPRKAEILSIRQRNAGLSFYVHYVDFNKRLDEWVDADRIDLTQEVEWPAPEKPEKKKTTITTKQGSQQTSQTKITKQTNRARSDSRAGTATPDILSAKAGNDRKRLAISSAGGKENNEDGMSPEPTLAGAGTPLPTLSQEDSCAAETEMKDVVKT